MPSITTSLTSVRRRLGALGAGLTLGLLVSTLGALPPAAAATPMLTVSASTTVGLPSWWNGSMCDAARWNKLAPSYGWTIDSTHPGSHALGASYLGVPVCGPRPGIDGSPDILWARSGWGESEWECVELAQRFMAQFYGVSAYGANGGYVVDNYRTSFGGGLVRYYNTATPGIAPTPGDIISMTTPLNPYGHVVVVAGSTVDGNGNGTLTLLSQNDTYTGWRTINVVSWKVIGFNTFTVKDWLHDPAGRANPLADGTFVRVSGTTQVYRLAGGAPVPVTDWTQFGGIKPVYVIAQAQFDRFHTYPVNGTYIKDALTGQAYRMAGGAPEAIGGDAAKLPGWGKAPVIAVDHNAIVNNAHLRAYPADNTYVCDVTTTKCYTTAGGAPMYVPPTDTALLPGWKSSAITQLSDAEFTGYGHLRANPADGTYMCDVTTTYCYEAAGGAPFAITPTDATKLPGWSSTAAVKLVHWEFTNYTHLRRYPQDGTQVCNVVDGSCYVTAGGAPLYVTPTTQTRLTSFAASKALKVSGAEFKGYAHLRVRPVDGTVIVGAQTGEIFQVVAGVARHVSSGAATLAATPKVSVDQAAIDYAGRTGPYSHLGSVPSNVTILSPAVRLMAANAAYVSWARPIASSAVTGFDIRVERSAYNAGFTAWIAPTSWQNYQGTHVWDFLAPGSTACYEVRAHNAAGQTGAWSAACVTNALDDRFAAATTKGFTAASSTTAYNGTLSRTTTHAAFWALSNVTLDRVSLLATTCPTCGSVTVWVDHTVIGTISLYSATTKNGVWLSLPKFSLRTGKLILSVSSLNGRLVQLDGVATSRL